MMQVVGGIAMMNAGGATADLLLSAAEGWLIEGFASRRDGCCIATFNCGPPVVGCDEHR